METGLRKLWINLRIHIPYKTICNYNFSTGKAAYFLNMSVRNVSLVEAMIFSVQYNYNLPVFKIHSSVTLLLCIILFS
jgi:hypothetical protein